MIADIENLLPMTEDDLIIENSKLMSYFKHIDVLEEQFSKILEQVPLNQFD